MFIAFYSSSQFTVLALARLDIPANPQGSWGRGRGICSPNHVSGQGGRPASRGQVHSSPSHGPEPSLLCPCRRGVLLDPRMPLAPPDRTSSADPHPSPGPLLLPLSPRTSLWQCRKVSQDPNSLLHTSPSHPIFPQNCPFICIFVISSCLRRVQQIVRRL